MDRGHSPELAQTMSVNMPVILEIFHLFFIRNMYGAALTWVAVRGTPAVWISLSVIVPAQFIVTYVPVAQAVLGTAPVLVFDGALMLAIGAVFFATTEIEKQIRLTFRGKNGKLGGAGSPRRLWRLTFQRLPQTPDQDAARLFIGCRR